MTPPLHFGRVLTGSEGAQSRPDQDIPAILREVGEVAIDCGGFVTHRASLQSLQEVTAAMRSGEVIHSIVKP